jgi:DNA-binding IclR family transcriptional regulator
MLPVCRRPERRRRRKETHINRTSPAVERAVSILNFLAEHESDTYTLSELARRLDMAKATGHTILATLVEGGLVTRNADREYSLGPAVIPLGEAASHQNRAVAIGRREIRLIAEDLGLDVILTTVLDHSIVVVGKSSAAQLERNDLRVLYLSQRIPLAPPIGAIFVAWWDRSRIDEWLNAAHDVWAPDRRQRYLDALAAVRERGYSVSAIASDALNQVRKILGSVDALSAEGDLSSTLDGFIEQVRNSEGYMVTRLAPDSLYELSSIAAPVFDRSGHVVLAITVQGFLEAAGRGEIERLGERLVSAAASVTEAIGGRKPAVR